MKNLLINKKQTEIIKGIGILLIVLHNYFHWVSPNTGENEFTFNKDNIVNAFHILSESYLNIINVLFSFLGHYGVQLFIFISGYGLTKSYQKKTVKLIKFLTNRALKIYPTFIISIILLILYKIIIQSEVPTIYWCYQIALKIMMVHTLIPNEALSINGPWWFYGLIIQLYILFIPLYLTIKKWKSRGYIYILIISYVSSFLLYTPLNDWDIYIMANSPAHLPEFALGILLALDPELKAKLKYNIIFTIIFILGNCYFVLFPFTFITITYITIFSLTRLSPYENKFINFTMYYGKISMYLFAVHGFIRNPLFSNWANSANNPIKTIIIGVLYLISVTIVAHFSRQIHIKIINPYIMTLIKKIT